MTHLLVLLVPTSAAASTQTTILPTAPHHPVDGGIQGHPGRLRRMHARYLTPTVSTVAMGLASIIYYVALTVISGNVLADSIASLGIMIAFYGLTGFACAWYYRHDLTRSPRDLLVRGLLPVLGVGLILLYARIRPAYFRSEVLNRRTRVVVLNDGTVAAPHTLTLPDSPSQEHLVLPPGAPEPPDRNRDGQRDQN
jgi:amino acid transporter